MSQLNFYITPTDANVLIDRIRALEPTLLLHSRAAGPRPTAIDALLNNEDQWLYYFLVRATDASRVELTHVASQAYWSVDEVRSPVIEFTTSYFDGRILRRGRIHHVDHYYGVGGIRIEKETTFREWTVAVRAIVKGALVKHGSDYIGHAALSWVNAGGQLEAT